MASGTFCSELVAVFIFRLFFPKLSFALAAYQKVVRFKCIRVDHGNTPAIYRLLNEFYYKFIVCGMRRCLFVSVITLFWENNA